MGSIKEYRLLSWPRLGAPYDKIAYRRMLSDLSHRHMTVRQLAGTSGIRRQEVQAFLDMLGEHGLLAERDAAANDSLFGSLRPLSGWLRRAIGSSATD